MGDHHRQDSTWDTVRLNTSADGYRTYRNAAEFFGLQPPSPPPGEELRPPEYGEDDAQSEAESTVTSTSAATMPVTSPATDPTADLSPSALELEPAAAAAAAAASSSAPSPATAVIAVGEASAKGEEGEGGNKGDGEKAKAKRRKGRKRGKKEKEKKPKKPKADGELLGKPVSMIGLFRFSDKKDGVLLAIGLLATIAIAVMFPFFSIAVGQITDGFVTYASSSASAVAPKVEWGTIERACMYLLIISVVSLVLFTLMRATFGVSARRQSIAIRRCYFENALSQEIGWYDRQAGQVVSRLESVQKIEDAITKHVAEVVRSIFGFIASLIIGFWRGWKLSLVLLSSVPILFFAIFIIGRIAMRFGERAGKEAVTAGQTAEESLSSVRTVVALGMQKFVLSTYGRSLAAAASLGITKSAFKGMSDIAFWTVMYGCYAIAFWYGSTLVTKGELSTGSVVTVFFSIVNAAQTLSAAMNSLSVVQEGRIAAREIFGLIDRHSEIDPRDPTGYITDIKGAIEFASINFSYPTRKDAKVLNDFSFVVDPGQTVAFVGHSGCGKSTLVSLLLRFYDVPKGAGEVRIDGRPIGDYNLRALREQIGVVPQEPTLFAATIAENIAWACNPAPTRDEIIEAATKANAHPFISSLPNGYDTLVGERGLSLSGGQKQRIAIARALVRKPKILIFDEATSALDTESEQAVQTAIERACVGVTCLLIAHRLTTIRNASLIGVLQGGTLAEVGTHDELMAEEGIYYHMVEKQQADAGNDIRSRKRGRHPRARTIAVHQDKPPVLPPSGLKEGAASAAALADEQEAVAEVPVDQDEVEMKSSRTLAKAFKMMRPDAVWVTIAVTAAFLFGTSSPIFSFLFSEMISSMTNLVGPDLEKNKRHIAVLTAIMVGLGVATGLMKFVQVFCIEIAGERLARRLRYMSFRAMLRQEIGWFDDKKHRVGILTHQLAADATLVHDLFGTTMCTAMHMSATMIAGIVVGFMGSWKLAAVVLSVVPALIIPSAIYVRSYAMREQRIAKTFLESSKIASEALESIRTVSLLCSEDYLVDRYDEELRKVNNKSIVLYSFLNAICYVETFVVAAVSLYYGGKLASRPKENVTFDDVLKTMNGVMFGVIIAGDMAGNFPNYSRALIASKSIFQLLERKPLIPPGDDDDVDSPTHASLTSSSRGSPSTSAMDGHDSHPLRSTSSSLNMPELSAKQKRLRDEAIAQAMETGGISPTITDFQGEIEFRGVYFSYPTRPTLTILDNFSFRARPQETVALVGPSGCGKSTVMSLLERMYDPSGGAILLDGKPINRLDITWLRSQMAIVSQEPVLFATTIKENIRQGKPNATEKEIVAAAKLANAHNFISSFPNGYDTMVGDRGAMLSGGQKQRIAIARALIRDPKVLLLDEATSALDAESELAVQKALDIARLGRTTLVIAHRLSTIKDADRIFVLNHGKAVETGTHAGLMGIRGLYYTLATQQDKP